MSFIDIKTQYLKTLKNLASFIIFPQDRLDAIKKSGFSDFYYQLKKYNKLILEARSLYVQLQTLTKFGLFVNSQRAWTYSITKCASYMELCRSEAYKLLTSTKNGIAGFAKNAIVRQSGVTNSTMCLLYIQKENGTYVMRSSKETKKFTYDQVCAFLPRPLIEKSITVEITKLDLDSSDRLQENI